MTQSSTVQSQLDSLQRQIDNIRKNYIRAEVTNGLIKQTESELPTSPFIAGRLRYVTDALKGVYVDNGAAWQSLYALPSLTVTSLNALTSVVEGTIAYASDGQQVGGGTGVLVYYDGSDWLRASDDTVVTT